MVPAHYLGSRYYEHWITGVATRLVETGRVGHAELEHLRAHGPTPTAFTFRHRFEPEGDNASLGSERDTCPA